MPNIRVFDQDGVQVGAAPLVDEPDPDGGVIEFEGKTYRWNAEFDQWREEPGSRTAEPTTNE